LQELIGTNRSDLTFAHRFISIFTDSNGGIKIKFNRAIPLPKGSEIQITCANSSTVECLWEHRTDRIGNIRLGVVNQTLERNNSIEGRQIFNTLPKDFLVSQMVVFGDDPVINVDEYNLLMKKIGTKARGVNFLYGFNEGNFFVIQPDGNLKPLFSGFEDLGKAGFYGWVVPPLKPTGDTHQMFYYGPGKYIYNYKNDDELQSISYSQKEEMFSLAFNDTPFILSKGARLMIMPGFAPCETARVTITLFGYYRVEEDKKNEKDKTAK